MLHDAALRFVKESEDSLAVNDTTFLSQKPYNLEYAAVRRFVSALSSQPATQFLFVMEILALCVQNKRCYVGKRGALVCSYKMPQKEVELTNSTQCPFVIGKQTLLIGKFICG